MKKIISLFFAVLTLFLFLSLNSINSIDEGSVYLRRLIILLSGKFYENHIGILSIMISIGTIISGILSIFFYISSSGKK